MGNPHETFSAGRLICRNKAPYFRSALLSFAAIEAPGLGTIGVSERGVLIWDPAFVARVTPAQMGGLFCHEVMHFILKHGERSRRAGRNPKLDNLAADLAINPSVIDMGFELPTGDIGPVLPEQFGFKRGLTVDEYYELLLQKQEQMQKQAAKSGGQKSKGAQGEKGEGQGASDSDGEEEGDDASGEGGGGKDADHDHAGQGSGAQAGQEEAEGAKDQSQGGAKESASQGQPDAGAGQSSGLGTDTPHAAGGWCGSCAGRALPGEPKTGSAQAAELERSEAEVERLVRQVAEAVRDHASKNRGTVPAALARWADKALEPPRIPWQNKLALVTRAAVAWRPGAVDYRYDSPGRRQAGLGFGSGVPIMPRMRQPVPEVMVIADTSGSMGSNELGDVCRETRGIMKAVGARITFAVCDAQVHGIRKVDTVEQIVASLRGGGGTDMRPAFAEALKLRPRPEVIICITDGLVGDGVPPVAPPGVKVVWVGVGPHRQRPCNWGEYIECDSTPSARGAAA